MAVNKTFLAIPALLLLVYTNVALAAEDITGVVKMRRPYLANFAIKGTIDKEGNINLVAENGTKTTGVISNFGKTFKATLNNETSLGKFFLDGKTTTSFVVNGYVKQGMYVGEFNSTDEGQLVLCEQRAYKKYEAECTGNAPIKL